jgi:hypothetical protein
VASDSGFVQDVIDQGARDRAVLCKKLVGEYGLFSEKTTVGMVRDNRLFLKRTVGGSALIGEVVDAPPHPGVTPVFPIEERIDDGPWLSGLVRITTRELPAPEPRKRTT